MRHERIVVIGGGTGTYTALMGLKHYSRNVTTIVTMADDGGSSGRLRDEFGHLPPGDTRRSLVALSANGRVNELLRTLFEYRFDRGYGLNGHSFGNLFLTALTEVTGSTEQAIQEASRLLNVRGRVLPVTVCDSRLWAELEDGTHIRGEHNIDVRTVKPDVHIKRVFLRPEAEVYPQAAEAIRSADLLVIGPGDLYTSLIPNLLVNGVSEAVQECRGTRLMVCNLMTKHGETDGYPASRFIQEIGRYLGGLEHLDAVLVNSASFAPDVLDTYAQESAYPVAVDLDLCLGLGPRIVMADLCASGPLVRHDSKKLAKAIAQVRRAHQAELEQGGVDPASEVAPAAVAGSSMGGRTA